MSVKPAPPLPDDADQDERLTLLFDVWLVARATLTLVDRELATTPLDAESFAVYSVIREAGAITPTQLARWMAMPATTVSSQLKRYERRGHVERVPDPADGRSWQLRLTEAGAEAHAAAAMRFLPALRRVEHALGAEAPAVTDALRSLRRALDVALASRSDALETR